ncbi:hypothetical protein [Nocardia bovistercoris]|uniref:Uncharacterized protein n=1 Tax=Nocardia bovistercoris TaxID=2785916 RepID=A0A931IG50_9NOCA|nr:hypothetical protein [Nocardia bovistercoris]MBH0779791.1 hypothetical protein [Nocardia bovistercoris]
MTAAEMTSRSLEVFPAVSTPEPTHVFCDMANPGSIGAALERLDGDGGVVLHLTAVPGTVTSGPISIVVAALGDSVAFAEGAGS